MFSKLDEVESRYENVNLQLQNPEIASQQNKYRALMKELADLEKVVVAYRAYKAKANELKGNKELLNENDIEVLYDDRDARAGEKFADSDLIGIPVRLVVSEKTFDAGGVEMVERATGKSKLVPEAELLKMLNK